MGLRGPAPKPSELKKLEGTYRADRAASNEPKPKVMIPRAPTWLGGLARKEYTRIAKLLVINRVLTEVDGTALASYAYQYAKWLEAEQMVTLHGAVLTSDKGGMYLNPWQGVANMAFKNMTKLMGEFGLTPASRSRIEAQPEDVSSMSLADKLFAGVSLE